MNWSGSIKNYIKWAFRGLGIDLTRNMKYDRLTSLIISRHLRRESSAIDVGAHTGEILKEFLRIAPGGHHFAVEPIPVLFKHLHEKYGSLCTVLPYALGAHTGRTTFHIVKEDPAYSGIKQRDLGGMRSSIDQVEVELRTLDELIPVNQPIDLIKIDVEGGEFDVLKGARELLHRCHPLIIFEFGQGAADKYGVRPFDLLSYFQSLEYGVFSLEGYLKSEEAIAEPVMSTFFETGSEYYFIAAQINRARSTGSFSR
jgi:FkbM family methyltransferase